MRSLRARILLTASLVLITFLGCASALLDRAFRDSALNAVEDRLRGRVFMLIGAADFDAVDAASMIDSLPDPSLSTPGSGNYARILPGDGHGRWESRSLLGLQPPDASLPEAGEWRLERLHARGGESLFSLTYSIIWEGAGETAPRRFVIQAYENEAAYHETVGQFRRSLWSWFVGLSVALLLVQALNLSWGLRPLWQVGEEVRAIERGERARIAGDYPTELSSLTRNLNDLIAHNRDNLRRYRNALGDLAHSLKTPLAVLRNYVESTGSGLPNRDTLEQLDRIDRTVEYQLHRAATAGRSLMAPPLPVQPVVERVADSLRKVHAARGIELRLEVDAEATFPGDEGDLMEIVGNLADNACKWSAALVFVRVVGDAGRLRIEVRDDGPGIPDDKLGSLMQRGARLDHSVEGHGIGLAIVREIVEDAFGGTIEFESSEDGTLVRVEIETG